MQCSIQSMSSGLPLTLPTQRKTTKTSKLSGPRHETMSPAGWPILPGWPMSSSSPGQLQKEVARICDHKLRHPCLLLITYKPRSGCLVHSGLVERSDQKQVRRVEATGVLGSLGLDSTSRGPRKPCRYTHLSRLVANGHHSDIRPVDSRRLVLYTLSSGTTGFRMMNSWH
jgi:hypothetical protein